MEKNYIGIDFGTSNCAVAAYINGVVVNIPVDENLDDRFKIRSSIFIREEDKPLEAPSDDRINYFIGQIKSELTRDKNKYVEELSYLKHSPSKSIRVDGIVDKTVSLSRKSIDNALKNIDMQLQNNDVLKSRAKRLAVAEIYAEVKETTLDKLLTSGTIEFGDKGFNLYLSSPNDGRLINSPKNFLGADINQQHLQNFESVVARFLLYLRLKSESYLERSITRAVIARPVQYHSTLGEQGNTQAINLMERAAAAAGFDEVVFIYEPLAAALHFETKLEKESVAMIIDLGGGTSDVVICKLNPERSSSRNRENDILAVNGNRVGGISCDKDFAMSSISPYFGRGDYLRDGSPIPHMLFNGMVDVDNLPILSEFYKTRRGSEIASLVKKANSPEKLEKLISLQRNKLVHRLMSDVEQAKIALSSKESLSLPLNYIDDKTNIILERETLNLSMSKWLFELKKLIEDSISIAKVQAECIYLTGGMALSPIVQRAVKDWFPDISLHIVDPFSSVVSGAAIHAHLEFGNR